ncbi:chalcone isomerase family protein [bacterium]|nr:chalcone isomerase family protein [bacterium]MBU1071985.1 chalcone isomerase family protein [bacterium]MBU1674287.1 chalcone isomerase family protein [bacterium]
MRPSSGISSLFALLLLLLPLAAGAVVEPKTLTEYPDQITVESDQGDVVMKVTGAGLREKTFLKVDVYTIASYVDNGATLEGEPGVALCALDAPKRIQMDLRRGFSRDKLINAFIEGIEKNVEDTSGIADDMETFKAYFTRDAQDGDLIIFDYCPLKGLTTILNGEITGVIDNFDFVKAMWTVWFGEKPANNGLKQALLSQITG